MIGDDIRLAAGMRLLLVGPTFQDEWVVAIDQVDLRVEAEVLSSHPTREAAVLAATDVASCCAAALAVARGCGRAAL